MKYADLYKAFKEEFPEGIPTVKESRGQPTNGAL